MNRIWLPLLIVLPTGIPCVAGDISVSGAPMPQLKPLDLLVSEFLAEHKAPGAALAVTKDARLVYARGFVQADPHHPVQPTSLFRIASVSKPFMAAAVFQLIEHGKLHMEDHAFDLLKLQPLLERGATVDPRWKQITIQCIQSYGRTGESVVVLNPFSGAGTTGLAALQISTLRRIGGNL